VIVLREVALVTVEPVVVVVDLVEAEMAALPEVALEALVTRSHGLLSLSSADL